MFFICVALILVPALIVQSSISGPGAYDSYTFNSDNVGINYNTVNNSKINLGFNFDQNVSGNQIIQYDFVSSNFNIPNYIFDINKQINLTYNLNLPIENITLEENLSIKVQARFNNENFDPQFLTFLSNNSNKGNYYVLSENIFSMPINEKELRQSNNQISFNLTVENSISNTRYLHFVLNQGSGKLSIIKIKGISDIPSEFGVGLVTLIYIALLFTFYFYVWSFYKGKKGPTERLSKYETKINNFMKKITFYNKEKLKNLV